MGSLFFLVGVFFSFFSAHADSPPRWQTELNEALLKAEKAAMSDPLGSRHLVFAHAAITAPVGYSSILLNIARDPDVPKILAEAADGMKDETRKTWVSLMSSA